MSEDWEIVAQIAAIGAGATIVMDGWLQLLKRVGMPSQNFAMLGRWIGHWADGQWHHAAITKAPPVRGETWMGWAAHYAIGIAFAGLLVLAEGAAWIRSPSLTPALMLGVASVAAPLLVLQPALGAGIASTNTPAPFRNSMKSLANHTVFGLGLYLAAVAINTVGVL